MKKLFSFILANLIIMMIWAMPGFESYIPDISGEYVYYKDNTFNRESYLGILYYDESTIEVRYFAPTNPSQGLPEKEISILFTINPDSSYLELTGERILSTITPESEDVELVNYLHDMLYEFSAHRTKVDSVESRTVSEFQDFPQFGGSVKITYDCTIPIFNIREISKPDGTRVLSCCTTGKIANSNDASFRNFKGFKNETFKKTNKPYKKAKTVKASYENQKVTLDKNWENVMTNVWSRGSDSMLSLVTIPPVSEDKIMSENYLIRFFRKSQNGAYMIFDTLKIDTDDDKIKIFVESYNPETKKTVVNDIIMLANPETNKIDVLTLATFKQPWVDNKKYYEKIVKSYEN